MNKQKNEIKKSTYFFMLIYFSWVMELVSEHQEVSLQGSDKPGKNSIFCDTQGKPVKLREF